MRNYKDEIIAMIQEMEDEDFLFKIFHYAVVKYRKEKGGVR